MYDSFVDLEEENVLTIVKERLEKGESPTSIMDECKEAVGTVGEKFDKGEYFLNDLVFAGEIFSRVNDILKPKIKEGDEVEEELGKIVIGTVQDDVHNIGKNIQISLLEANGFKVYDLGVDVPPEEFVQEVTEKNPNIVGLSCLISSAWDSLEETIEKLEEAGLRNSVKIILGGAMVDEEIAEKVGADSWTNSAQEGVNFCKEFVDGD